MNATEISAAVSHFRNLTLEERKALRRGATFYDRTFARWRVSGRVKTWKRDSSRIVIPAKFGLYQNAHFDAEDTMLVGPDAMANALRKVVKEQKLGFLAVAYGLKDQGNFSLR